MPLVAYLQIANTVCGRGTRHDPLQVDAVAGISADRERREVLRGVRSDERRAAERLFWTVDWIGVDETIAGRAGEMGRIWRRSHQGIATADLIIAATAAEHGHELATMSVRRFPMIKRLKAPYHP